jgi:predicted aldo/keto reductase-like oxidoreductase
MQYRDFGTLDFKPSALGFGAMRLPVLAGEDGRPDFARIDADAATAMLHRAVDGGVNYVDTAWVYHEQHSEGWLGEALKGGYRERVKIATKMPVWQVEKPGDFERILETQLKRLGEDAIDFYLLHSLDDAHWKCVLDQDQLASAEKALADGRIRHFGFSFHGTYDLFEEVLAATDLWEFCQLQFNYMDEEEQAGRRGLELAAGRGLGVIVMEPIRGGMLAGNLPPRVEELWAGAPVERSPAEWALQWVWSVPEVSFVLSGMTTMEHVEENLAAAGRSRPGLLTAEELALVARVRDVYRELSPIPCTACRYCMPCPQGVEIPDILSLYNDAHMYGDPARQRVYYTWLDEGARADSCTACGECESVCPQGIAVAAWMEKAQALLGVAPPD